MPRLTRMLSPIERRRGYTLIEVLIALLIALFLLAGLGTMVAGTRTTSTNQSSLAQLQDEERLAMSVLNDVIQTAGYFDTNPTDPTYYWTAATAFPAAVTTSGGPGNPSLAAGQILGGTHTSGSSPDTIAVRYGTSGNDGIINCNGGTSTVPTTYVNFFFVKTTGTTSQLQCSIDGAAGDAIVLVDNVVNLQIWYGISTVAGVTNADTYKTADLMTATDWPNVVSARVILTLNNPLFPQPGQAAYTTFTRVVVLKSRIL